MDWITIVRVLGTLVCTLTVVGAWYVASRKLESLSDSRSVSIGIATLSATAFWKLSAFVTLVALPAATIAVANYHTFVGIHEVQACSQCHVMRPMVTDLHDPTSDTLASRHFKNGYIPSGQCYACHSDYGFSGDMAAKMEGFRHLARYTTRTYHEPLAARTRFNNHQCLKCHRGKTAFETVHVHHDVIARLESSDMSCLNCHGRAHPTRQDRTPGSERYEALMTLPDFSEDEHE
jgi:cytochrome c nitrite reductase small subunit